jgi:hypothetical protein
MEYLSTLPQYIHENSLVTISLSGDKDHTLHVLPNQGYTNEGPKLSARPGVQFKVSVGVTPA